MLFAYLFAVGALLVGAGFLARRGRRNALPIGAPSRRTFSDGEIRLVAGGFWLMFLATVGGALWLMF